MDAENLRLVNTALSLAVAGMMSFRLVRDWQIVTPAIRRRIASQGLFFAVLSYASVSAFRSELPVADYLPFATASLALVLVTLIWPDRRR